MVLYPLMDLSGEGERGEGGAEINLIDRQLNQGVEFTWELL